ncbi:prostatic acid phosphatase-like [Paramacrobiotus metropolitanus]|uniref:prostatic acid phosphatase-like n=1 Tax=Paramacrobiotus metropolitanus TaxID=2943436 RepID=UPI00244597EC|nr:prostatic acid phosphatase-like [Paramacrobiotus metropolitanus]
MNFQSPLISAVYLVLTHLFSLSWAVEVVEDLKLVQLIFRHGDRAPIHTYKEDKVAESVWLNGFARLTPKGMKQQFELGKFFKQRYQKLLDPLYGPNQVYIRSSETDRTLQSAEAFAAGLFPPDGEAKWDNVLGQMWRPISVHTVPLSEENLLTKKAPCPEYFRLKADLMNTDEMVKLYKEYRNVFDYVVNKSGEVATKRRDAMTVLEHVHDAVFCQLNSAGLERPEWMNETVYNILHYLDAIEFHLQVGANGDIPRARLAGGNLLALLLQRMDERAGKAPLKRNDTRMFVYSGHDTTVAGLLATLEMYNYNDTLGFMGVPNYTATVIFELFQNDSVRLLLKNDLDDIPNSEPQILKHARCDALCPLKQLREVTKHCTVENWNKECQSPVFGAEIDVSDVTVALVTVLLVIILTTIALGCYKRRSRNTAASHANVAAHGENGVVVTYTRLNEDDNL